MKTWQIARALILHAQARKLRVLCTRETMKSIKESVHHELETQIGLVGIDGFWNIKDTTIRGANGSEFIFAGLRIDPASLKSYSDIDIVWVEEAAQVSIDSWKKLIPTIRKTGSEIWISFNPELETDPVYVRFLGYLNDPKLQPDPNAIVVKTGWQDNPWLSQELKDEIAKAYATDVEDADHIWGGEPIRHSNASIFADKCIVQDFVPSGPGWLGPFFGADGGFASDPATLVKVWVHGRRLYVEEEVGAVGVDLMHLPQLFTTVTGWWRYEVDKRTGKEMSTKIPLPNVHIEHDCAAASTISHLQSCSVPAVACKKWPGSVEDGIKVLRMFEKIVIHSRCRGLIEESKLYRYKVDKVTKAVLNVIVDAHNHYWDAIRYALEDVIMVPERNLIHIVDSPEVQITPELDTFEAQNFVVPAFGVW